MTSKSGLNLQRCWTSVWSASFFLDFYYFELLPQCPEHWTLTFPLWPHSSHWTHPTREQWRAVNQETPKTTSRFLKEYFTKYVCRDTTTQCIYLIFYKAIFQPCNCPQQCWTDPFLIWMGWNNLSALYDIYLHQGGHVFRPFQLIGWLFWITQKLLNGAF